MTDLNKLYGLADHVSVIKESKFDDGVIVLIKVPKMSHFTPKGRARLASRNTYDVRCIAFDGEFTEVEGSRYNFKTKAEAVKYFNSIK